jgi:hypothetical protein
MSSRALREAKEKLYFPLPHHVVASLGSPRVSAAKVIVYKQPQGLLEKASWSPDPHRPWGATLAGTRILQSQISELE